jgi:uncharacterized membrane protein (DUF2068 family)
MDRHDGHVHPDPVAVDERTSAAGLRTVASFEALKGAVVLLLMLLLLGVHHHVDDIAENLLSQLHIDPDLRISQAFLSAAYRLSDMRLLTITGAAMAYSTVRFVEAWGLWNRRVWAEWFALLSGALYLPWEILKVAQKSNWLHIGILAINVLVVLYMLYIRIRSCRPPAQCEPEVLARVDER